MVRELHLRAEVLPGGRIEVTDAELPVGQTVEVVVRHESGGESRSIMEILNSGPERRLFQTADEVKAYLDEEKASWDRQSFPLPALSTSIPVVSSTVWSEWNRTVRYSSPCGCKRKPETSPLSAAPFS